MLHITFVCVHVRMCMCDIQKLQRTTFILNSTTTLSWNSCPYHYLFPPSCLSIFQENVFERGIIVNSECHRLHNVPPKYVHVLIAEPSDSHILYMSLKVWLRIFGWRDEAGVSRWPFVITQEASEEGGDRVRVRVIVSMTRERELKQHTLKTEKSRNTRVQMPTRPGSFPSGSPCTHPTLGPERLVLVSNFRDMRINLKILSPFCLWKFVTGSTEN